MNILEPKPERAVGGRRSLGSLDGHATLGFHSVGGFEPALRASASSDVSYLSWSDFFSHDGFDAAESDVEQYRHPFRCHVRGLSFSFAARPVAESVDIHHRRLGLPCGG